ncbi:Oxysterol-binding protein-related protein 6 [Armadillidium vulgare]|nr:Oxysterol-binding protein-related protein 6 [Armadillidium vulgare]
MASKKGEWEILEGLKEGQRFELVPRKFEGYLLKRRKWPLKGWHKRFFVLDQSVLVYSKSAADLARGKKHGSMDIGMSVISTKARRKRIDIDADSNIFHLKCKSIELYLQWVEQLKQHRLYKQHQLLYSKNASKLSDEASSPDDSPTGPLSDPLISSGISSLPSSLQGTLNRDSKQNSAGVVGGSLAGAGTLRSWLVDSSSIDHLGKDIEAIQLHLGQLSNMIDTLDDISQIDGNLADLRPLSSSNPALSLQSGLISSSSSSRPHSCSDANSNLTSSGTGAPPHTPSPTATTQVHHCTPLIGQQPPAISLDSRFLPQEINNRLIFSRRAKQNFSSSSVGQCDNSLQQNAELRGRLSRIHEDSNLAEVSVPVTTAEMLHRTLHTSMSYESSSCFSTSEYFDAPDGASDGGATDTSSEVSSDVSSFTSEASDAGTDAHPSGAEIEVNKCYTGRRVRLPVPKPPTEDFSPFKFLYKNIGKDLSKVCMPISINEPLNMLQRLCEELEYSELLDKAAGLHDPTERMIQVAAFAVSSYASTIYRAAHKPFNPLLGETYECIREDKGFKFIAEQVNHHPPVSACHAVSNNYIFWQDLRIKTKFWGRSLEFQPSGTVYVYLPNHEERYEWNKVTSCVHNLYGGGQRWVDQYGEMIITNKTKNITCKLTFVKANSWTSKHHEVLGSITDAGGNVLQTLFGKWTESLYCGHAPSARVVWRPGSMPEDYQLYYGFTRFAIELNELDPEHAKYLPPTDTRFRPDQRLLERRKSCFSGE